VKKYKYIKLLPYIVLSAMLALSVLIWQFYQNAIILREESRFDEYTDRILENITERLHQHEMVIHNGAGIFTISEDVTRGKWRAYYEYKQIGALYPGMQAFGFSKVVRRPELAKHIEEIRAEGFPDYTVWPEGESQVYIPVIFAEPVNERNQGVFGFDINSEPVRREALERARDSGSVSRTGMVNLVGETGPDTQLGFLIFAPVYKNNIPLDTTDQRIAAIEGYTYGVFRIDDLMEGIFTHSTDNIAFQIYDGVNISPEALLYESNASTDASGEEHKSMFASQKTLDLYGQPWILTFRTTPAFEATVDQFTSKTILAAGLLISFLIFFYLKMLQATGDRAHSIAQKMTSTLKESECKYRFLTENINDVIWNTDLDGRLIYMSPAIEKLTGYTSEEILAMPLHELIVQEDYDALITKLAEELAKPPAERENSTIMPARHRTKDNRIVDAEFSASWLLDEQNNISGVQGSTRDITERKLAEEEIRRQAERAESLLHVASTLNANLELKTVLHKICEETCTALHVPLAAFLLYDERNQTFELADSLSLPPGFAESMDPLPRKVYEELSQKLGKCLVTDDITTVPDLPYEELMKKFNISKFAYAFLERDGFPLGLLVAGAAGEEYLLVDDAPQLLSGLADQAASAISNADLFHKLKHSNEDLLKAYDATIEGWAYALSLKDEETENHSQHVVEMTLSIARKLGIAEEEIANIKRGALLHDIGKMGIPDDILHKPGKLTDDEWEIMHRHPRHAYDMLFPVDYLRPALDIPYSHHEKWDGSGYPHGLHEEEIPLAARIFAVVDVFDALTSDRPYRKAWSREKALDHIKQESGKHFDPQIVDIFLKLIIDKTLKI
jgi:PAS domain S-box-containing protein/putative nucleotidyltransferase with HDIG domain